MRPNMKRPEDPDVQFRWKTKKHSLRRKWEYSFLTPGLSAWGVFWFFNCFSVLQTLDGLQMLQKNTQVPQSSVHLIPERAVPKVTAQPPKQGEKGHKTACQPETNREGAGRPTASQRAPRAPRVPQVPLEAAACGESRARSRRTPVPPADPSSLSLPAHGTR